MKCAFKFLEVVDELRNVNVLPLVNCRVAEVEDERKRERGAEEALSSKIFRMTGSQLEELKGSS
jgi:hypothetical protein